MSDFSETAGTGTIAAPEDSLMDAHVPESGFLSGLSEEHQALAAQTDGAMRRVCSTVTRRFMAS